MLPASNSYVAVSVAKEKLLTSGVAGPSSAFFLCREKLLLLSDGRLQGDLH